MCDTAAAEIKNHIYPKNLVVRFDHQVFNIITANVKNLFFQSTVASFGFFQNHYYEAPMVLKL
ncbi:hypothetical protein DRF57_21980 [Chryseobacterium rhizosphaerae]|uniref:Uncharacterized protein n=1 Tax=Chryseobacterium rhizosphaerae TaxID=395937 RepID=A0ABX9IEE1_9FLAO|nr:hypothetical protein DRF57_21980 [Chryseobacterium rhizosphaerae]